MKLALGTVQFGLDYGISNPDGKTPPTEVNDILKFAYSTGIDNLDTAPVYGSSEENIGKYLDSHRDEKWKVVSKLPQLKSNENIETDFDNYFTQSKAWLGDSLDTYMAHNTTQFLSNPAVQNKFYSLKEQGLINSIGVSVYSEREINDVIELGGLDVIQLPLNILDHRLIKSGILKKIKDHRIKIHVRSVFLQGLFFLSDEELKNKFSDVLEPIHELKKIARTYRLELRDLALLFVKCIPEVDQVIVGVNNMLQLQENIDSFNKPCNHDISEEILSTIDYRNDNVLNPSRWKN